MRVLYIEDSKHLRKPVIRALKATGYAVDDASDGEDGLWQAQNNEYDVIILDLMLPKIDGLTVLETLRKEGKKSPVLILSAKDTVEDRVRGLQLGADDYLVKPFAVEELLARVEALSRRNYEKVGSEVSVADLVLDSAKKTVTRSGKLLTLAPKQFALLEHLMLRSGTVVSRTEIEAHLYDANADLTSNVVDAAISGLRKLIAVEEGSKPLIHTSRGHGYNLEDRDT